MCLQATLHNCKQTNLQSPDPLLQPQPHAQVNAARPKGHGNLQNYTVPLCISVGLMVSMTSLDLGLLTSVNRGVTGWFSLRVGLESSSGPLDIPLLCEKRPCGCHLWLTTASRGAAHSSSCMASARAVLESVHL